MTKTDKEGRCVECGLIPRPDIAQMRGESYCRCDTEFNQIYDGFRNFLKQNEKNIKKLAKRLNDDTTE